jgi:hypothetical protein
MSHETNPEVAICALPPNRTHPEWARSMRSPVPKTAISTAQQAAGAGYSSQLLLEARPRWADSSRPSWRISTGPFSRRRKRRASVAHRTGTPPLRRARRLTVRTYHSPEAFKQALEQRLRASTNAGAELGRKRQFLIFDRFLARIVQVFGAVARPVCRYGRRRSARLADTRGCHRGRPGIPRSDPPR